MTHALATPAGSISASLGAAAPETKGAAVEVTYQPILDVSRGVAAGYQAHVRHDSPRHLDVSSPWALGDDPGGRLTATAITVALGAYSTLPPNTFLSFPLAAHVVDLPAVREALYAAESLAGIVLDIVGPTDVATQTRLVEALAGYRAAGALIAVGGHGAPQPELTSIVRLKPSIVRLGRDWVRGLDTSASKRSAIEVIGRLAGQLDAWILAEGVSSSAELRSLAGLSVPLAQGSFIGDPQAFWPEIPVLTRDALPKVSTTDADGVLRGLVQTTYTATDAAAAAAILPETTGFDTVVVVDAQGRPVTLIEQAGDDTWDASDVMAVNIDTPVTDAVQRAMTRPRMTRFSPLVCTDDKGLLVGILRIERLMDHLSRS